MDIAVKVGQTYQPITIKIDALAMTEQVRRRLNVHYDDIVAKHKQIDGWQYAVERWHQQTLVLKETTDKNAKTAVQSATEAKTAGAISKKGASDSVIAKDDAVKAKERSETLNTAFVKAKADALAAAAEAKKSETASATKAGESKTSAANSLDAMRVSLQSSLTSTDAKDKSEAAQGKARQWADNGEGVAVETGKYSAHHWSIKANQSATSAADSADKSEKSSQRSETKSNEASSSASASKQSEVAAAGSVVAAKGSEDKAHKWAENPLDQIVDNDEYSAKHWAIKAHNYAQTVSSALVFKGDWDASTGNHPLTPTENHPEFYTVSKAGTIDGEDYSVGDNIVWSPTKKVWFRIDNSDRQITSDLTVDSETISLSARAGKLLEDKKLDHAGGVLSGPVNFTAATGTILEVGGKVLLARTTAGGGIGFGADEGVVIGAGESRGLMGSYIDPQVESLHLGADIDVIVYSNMQSGGGDRKTFTFKNDGSFTAGTIYDASGRCFSVGHPPSWGQVSSKPDFDLQYLAIGGTAKNAEKLGSRNAEGYARRDVISVNATVADGGEWLTMATVVGGGRASARFKVGESQSSRHGHVEFYAAVSYGGDPQITVLSAGGLSDAGGQLGKLRIIKVVDDTTYGEHKLQLFLGGNAPVTLYMYEDDKPHEKWVLEGLTERGMPSGYDTGVELNLAINNGINSTSDIYARGYRCFHAGNADQIVLPGYMKKSENLTGLSDLAQARRTLGIIGTDELPVYNLMRDSGTMSDVYKQDQPLGNASKLTFEPNIGFYAPYNGSTWAHVGTFVHGKVPTEEPVISLMAALKAAGRSSGYDQYGIPFCVGRLTMGPGTASQRSFNSQLFYLAAYSQSAYDVANHTGKTTFMCWLRVQEGSFLSLPVSTYLNGVWQRDTSIIKPGTGWFHFACISTPTGGYDSTLPYFFSQNGSKIDMALPVAIPGRVVGSQHLCPVPSAFTPYRKSAA